MKIKGKFCERTMVRAPAVDKRSLRWKKTGKSWLLIGCPKGKWDQKKQSCKVGTRAVKLLVPSPDRCGPGEKRISKGLGAPIAGKTGYVDLIPGGRASGRKPSDFDQRQLAMGIRVELEHTRDWRLAREIAMDHLTEYPDYYTRLLAAKL